MSKRGEIGRRRYPMTKPNELITEIEKALEAATPGPWEVDYAVITSVKVKGELNMIGTHIRRIDAPLIANAPEWLRALLEEVERLNHVLEQIEHDSMDVDTVLYARINRTNFEVSHE
jgi:hypothetical protein